MKHTRSDSHAGCKQAYSLVRVENGCGMVKVETEVGLYICNNLPYTFVVFFQIA